jgi:hypothetical protein
MKISQNKKFHNPPYSHYVPIDAQMRVQSNGKFSIECPL